MSQRDKPRLSLKNNTAGVRERSKWSCGPSDIEGKTTRVGASECGQGTSFNRTREAGNRDEVEGVAANTLKLSRHGASLLANTFGVGFIVWLDRFLLRVPGRWLVVRCALGRSPTLLARAQSSKGRDRLVYKDRSQSERLQSRAQWLNHPDLEDDGLYPSWGAD